MKKINIGLIGGGYMGKRHAIAMQSVGAVFNTQLRPHCEMICTSTEAGAAKKAATLGFSRSTSDWRKLVNDPAIDAVIIASPQETHRAIAEAAFQLNKPVLCEKPIGNGLDDAKAMTAAAEQSSSIDMVGFNYIRTPATQYARQLIERGDLGQIISARCEHHEDFYADPNTPASWRTRGMANGAMGDLAPHVINLAMYLLGPITEVSAQVETIHQQRPGDEGMEAVTNDDMGQFLCRFNSGALGNISVSRVAMGRKMGLSYEIFGTKGALRFDQEDQNALWFYRADLPKEQQGFTKILTNAEHPDYGQFCEGPGHGTGYQDQLIIEARDFLQAIETGTTQWPRFADGLEVAKVIAATIASNKFRQWININQ